MHVSSERRTRGLNAINSMLSRRLYIKSFIVPDEG